MAREYDDNSEQDDGDQAQDVAEDARNRHNDPSEDSERGGNADRTQVAPADEPDLVERMNAMVRSGIIDNDAFAGEPQMDDEEDGLGPTEDRD
ncbi:hypothetical protein LWE61_04910 [Sphingobium sufflavum]|uniref:hypothetical protein n=1 Tax=Sphingobium sufflavum TaxID=1129547 RepID=UPI001F30F9B6|nr:hypothetical protein [Sphingobium sufflavum]MCE7795899.1 hypothetical protein [Sphingobium sufflavum]